MSYDLSIPAAASAAGFMPISAIPPLAAESGSALLAEYTVTLYTGLEGHLYLCLANDDTDMKSACFEHPGGSDPAIIARRGFTCLLAAAALHTRATRITELLYVPLVVGDNSEQQWRQRGYLAAFREDDSHFVSSVYHAFYISDTEQDHISTVHADLFADWVAERVEQATIGMLSIEGAAGGMFRVLAEVEGRRLALKMSRVQAQHVVKKCIDSSTTSIQTMAVVMRMKRARLYQIAKGQ